jgi:A1 cistron-splicing factor AAR2
MEAYASTTTLVLLDVPKETYLTLDTNSFSSTASFRGIKYINQGIHLFTYGLDTSELGMRNGFFFLANPGDVSAWKWDPKTEQFLRIQEQIQGKALQERLQSLHPYLTTIPPPEDGKTSWSDLTSYITVDVLNRVLPIDWTFTSHTSSTNDEATDQLSSLPSSKSESILNFTAINLKRTFNPNSVGRERTDQILDKSYYLDTLLSQLPSELALLGELQLSFITVLYMNNFSGFEAWKNIFTVFCGCKRALRSKERLFRAFLTVLRQQFDMCSEETFNEVILEGNFVADNLKVSQPIPFNSLKLLKTLNQNIEDIQPKSSALEFSFAQLSSLLATKFNWDPLSGGTIRRVAGQGFDENAWDREDGDYAPVVVDVESDEDEGMDVDVNFEQRLHAGGHMDMKTGRMVFGSH